MARWPDHPIVLLGFDPRGLTDLEFKQGRALLDGGGGPEVSMGEGIFQPLHILLIIGIALLLFGPSKFADLGKGLGEGIRNFKSSMKDTEKKDEAPKPPAA
jgi:sec-independent protein translocase protein TatA